MYTGMVWNMWAVQGVVQVVGSKYSQKWRNLLFFDSLWYKECTYTSKHEFATPAGIWDVRVSSWRHVASLSLLGNLVVRWVLGMPFRSARNPGY